jgi:hypothetical protein
MSPISFSFVHDSGYLKLNPYWSLLYFAASNDVGFSTGAGGATGCSAGGGAGAGAGDSAAGAAGLAVSAGGAVAAGAQDDNTIPTTSKITTGITDDLLICIAQSPPPCIDDA